MSVVLRYARTSKSLEPDFFAVAPLQFAMERDRERFLRKLDGRLSRVTSWLAARARGGEQMGNRDLRLRIETLRREISRARQSLADAAHEDLPAPGPRSTTWRATTTTTMSPRRVQPRGEKSWRRCGVTFSARPCSSIISQPG